MTRLIQCLHISKGYPPADPVLQDINLDIFQGDFIFLLGKGGAGKSTFLKVLLGLEPPDQGHILIEERDISEIPPREIPFFRRQLGIVLQDSKLLMHRSVFRNVALPLEVAGSGEAFAQKRAFALLRMLGLEEKGAMPCKCLSASERQCVAIARAVVNDPVILFADDPTGGLDGQETRRVMKLLEDVRVMGATVILATHNASLPTAVPGSRVLILHQGKITEQTAAE